MEVSKMPYYHPDFKNCAFKVFKYKIDNIITQCSQGNCEEHERGADILFLLEGDSMGA